ncbi:MAG: hypothetical protein ACC742_04935 [Thermoanaerobaculales bacterium]
MTSGWILGTLLLPPALAVLAAVFLRPHRPGANLVIGLNAISPGSGLAAIGRPTLEVLLGVLFAQASLLIVGGVDHLGSYVPSMVVGGIWALLHTPLNPLTRPALRHEGRLGSRIAEDPSAPPPNRQTAAHAPQEAETEVDVGYCVEVGCSECGAAVEVPVLHRMAHCKFCGSNHLVVGHDETLLVVLPAKIENAATLREAVLDHYRYQHYLKLYRRTVAPLALAGTDVGPGGTLINRPELDAVAAPVEAAISRKADAYRRKLNHKLVVGRTESFLAPYRHGMGTLYQAAFGRSPGDEEKQLHFAVGTVEASTLATSSMELPSMGKLSYLKALRPAAACGPETRTLPLDLDEEELTRAFGNLDRRRLVRNLRVIRLGSEFNRAVSAIVWRPWWIAKVRGPGIDTTLLVDGGSGSVVGPAPALDTAILTDLPAAAREPGAGLRFVPMECPTCGHEFDFDPDAVLHFCHNCNRVCGVEAGRKVQVAYAHLPLPKEGNWDLLPFWQFPLRLRTADGELITDLMQLKDGIDGTLDQIGEDAPIRQHGLFIPAFRCINPRLMATAFNRLFLFTIRQSPPKATTRFPLHEQPRPWSVGLAEAEARGLAPLYLANAFNRRDLTRANVHQVASWLFGARQEAAGRLAYLPVPRIVTEVFRQYVGRGGSRAVRRATGRG